MLPEIRDKRKYVGMGVAILRTNGTAEKYKIKSVLTRIVDGDVHVIGVELDIPAFAMGTMVGGERAQGFDVWKQHYFHTSFVFRNKKEALTYWDEEGLRTARLFMEDAVNAVEATKIKLDLQESMLEQKAADLKEKLERKSKRPWNRPKKKHPKQEEYDQLHTTTETSEEGNV